MYNNSLRKIIHLSSLFFLLVYLIVLTSFNKQIALLFLAACLIAFLIYEYLRLEIRLWVPFRSIVRDKEKNRMTSGVYLLASFIICLAVFELNIAIAAIFMAIFGDTAASLVDKKKKALFNRGLANFVVSLLIGYFLTGIYTGAIMALTASIVEAIPKKVEDNLAVPIIAGFAGELMKAGGLIKWFL